MMHLNKVQLLAFGKVGMLGGAQSGGWLVVKNISMEGFKQGFPRR